MVMGYCEFNHNLRILCLPKLATTTSNLTIRLTLLIPVEYLNQIVIVGDENA